MPRMTDKEIEKLYYGGLTVLQISKQLASMEDIKKVDARARVENVICSAQRKGLPMEECKV